MKKPTVSIFSSLGPNRCSRHDLVASKSGSGRPAPPHRGVASTRRTSGNFRSAQDTRPSHSSSVTVHVLYTRVPPGRRSCTACPKSLRWILGYDCRTFGFLMLQESWGLLPRPLHGASNKMRSKLPQGNGGPVTSLPRSKI